MFTIDTSYHKSISTLLGFLNNMEDKQQREQLVAAALNIIASRNEIADELEKANNDFKNTEEDMLYAFRNQRIRFLNLMQNAGIDGEQYL